MSKASNRSTCIKLTWERNSSATGYKVYRSTNGGAYTCIATIKSNKTLVYYDKTATTNGAKYQYKIAAYKTIDGKTVRSCYSTIKTIYRLSTPTISSAKKTATTKVTVKWNKNSKATGYQIKYITGKTTKTVRVTSAKTLSKVISNLKKGKTYKFYVRSYKIVSGSTYYSKYSKVRSVKL